MNKLIGAFVCIGFLLVLCAAGASDCGTITLGQAIARAVTGTAMITAGILVYLHKEKTAARTRNTDNGKC